ncbi:uncharacterized protein TNCV_1339131 [Trichonephila clavipes]|uniref:Uncharacterized protein n=1 Tax=Trichonephila clavipes TaxID=2585209 RepID=A0A8X6RBQ2_TRICX|nr:uncharacterized protein TNCV_1339131 [Trichonephila clavipes]
MPQGLGSNPGKDMDVCKCIVPLRHGGTLNSRRAASPRVVGGRGRENTLKPIFEEEIPATYEKDNDKVEFHMDKACSNTSKSTATYLAKKESETGIKCIPFDEIRVKSPNTSLMDFCVLSLLKQDLRKQYPETLNNL